MISIISGEIGAGKTTLAVLNYLVKAVEDGRIIYTDFKIKKEPFIERFGQEAWDNQIKFVNSASSDLTIPHELTDIDRFKEILEDKDDNGAGPMVLLDEGHQIWPKAVSPVMDRKTGTVVPDCQYQKMINAFALIRHTASHLVVIVQNPDWLFRPLLELSTRSYFVMKTENVKKDSFKVKIWNSPYPKNSIKELTYITMDKPHETIGHPNARKYDRDIQKLFRSHTMIDGKGSENPHAIESKRQSKSIYKDPKLLFFTAVALLPLCLLIYKYFSGESAIINPDNLNIEDTSSSQNSVSTDITTVFDDEFSPSDLVDINAINKKEMESLFSYSIDDHRLYKYPLEDGSFYLDTPVNVYDSSGKIYYDNVPISWLSHKMNFKISNIECGFSLQKGNSNEIFLYVPGCISAVGRSRSDGRTASPEKSPPIRDTKPSMENEILQSDTI